MAFAIGAAHAASLADFDTIFPRADFGQHSKLIAANDSTVPTVNLFIDSTSPDYEYAASIVSACKDETVYALHCTSGPADVGSLTCGPNGAVATVTEGASTYVFSSAVTTSTAGKSVQATVQALCSLSGTTAAVCTASIGGAVDGTTAATTSTKTITGTDYMRFNVAITGGAEKTASATGTCAKGASGSLDKKAAAFWALAGVAAAIGVLGSA